jgi:hypothetical protein
MVPCLIDTIAVGILLQVWLLKGSLSVLTNALPIWWWPLFLGVNAWSFFVIAKNFTFLQDWLITPSLFSYDLPGVLKEISKVKVKELIKDKPKLKFVSSLFFQLGTVLFLASIGITLTFVNNIASLPSIFCFTIALLIIMIWTLPNNDNGGGGDNHNLNDGGGDRSKEPLIISR